MFSFFIGLLIGLVVGWNVLPQPQWAENIWNSVFGGGDGTE